MPNISPLSDGKYDVTRNNEREKNFRSVRMKLESLDTIITESLRGRKKAPICNVLKHFAKESQLETLSQSSREVNRSAPIARAPNAIEKLRDPAVVTHGRRFQKKVFRFCSKLYSILN